MIAGVEGIEPPLAVLETAVLPLNDTPNLGGFGDRRQSATLWPYKVGLIIYQPDI